MIVIFIFDYCVFNHLKILLCSVFLSKIVGITDYRDTGMTGNS